MRYQFKAVQFSLAFHALIILIIIGMSSSSVVPANSVIVIDFSIEDSMNGESSGAGTVDIAKTKPENKPKIRERKPKVINRETETKKQQLEVKESKEVIVPTPTLDTQVQVSEGEVPVSAYPETADFQYKSVQSVQTNFSTSTGDGMRGQLGGSGLAGKGTKLTSSGSYGNSDSDMLRRSRYLKENFSYIRDVIQKKVTYPRLARQMGWEGRVKVSFIISSDGNVRDIKVIQSSGKEVLDTGATKAVNDASPLPKPPVEARIIIPIVYRLD
ncbi:MAG: energy transducer TonB [Nitrospirae bacterium]|jgi:periplasmic protein TonB|nr:energy transducer TonB [Nitrospirota bacterium]